MLNQQRGQDLPFLASRKIELRAAGPKPAARKGSRPKIKTEKSDGRIVENRPPGRPI